MQLADIELALAGDPLNTVPRYKVTPSEVAMLTALHGADSVRNIELLPLTVTRSQARERRRVRDMFGATLDGSGTVLFDGLFPGAAARMFETFDELGLDPGQFTQASVEALAAQGRALRPRASDEDEGEDEDEEYVPSLASLGGVEDLGAPQPAKVRGAKAAVDGTETLG